MTNGKSFKNFTGKMERILNHCFSLQEYGKVSMNALAKDCGYDQAGDISGEVSFLVNNGYMERHGKRGTKDVHIIAIKRAPEKVFANPRKSTIQTNI